MLRADNRDPPLPNTSMPDETSCSCARQCGSTPVPIRRDWSCATCNGDFSGRPVAVTLSDAAGKFTLTLDEVPRTESLPLVVQVGKWRRLIEVPGITQCTSNSVQDGGRSGVSGPPSGGGSAISLASSRPVRPVQVPAFPHSLSPTRARSRQGASHAGSRCQR